MYILNEEMKSVSIITNLKLIKVFLYFHLHSYSSLILLNHIRIVSILIISNVHYNYINSPTNIHTLTSSFKHKPRETELKDIRIISLR